MSVLLPEPSNEAISIEFLHTQQLVKMLHMKGTLIKNFLVSTQNFVHLAEKGNTGREQNERSGIKSN